MAGTRSTPWNSSDATGRASGPATPTPAAPTPPRTRQIKPTNGVQQPNSQALRCSAQRYTNRFDLKRKPARERRLAAERAMPALSPEACRAAIPGLTRLMKHSNKEIQLAAAQALVVVAHEVQDSADRGL